MTASYRTAVRFLFLAIVGLASFSLHAQTRVEPSKSKSLNTYAYNVMGYGDTTFCFVSSLNGQQKVWRVDPKMTAEKHYVPGFAQEVDYIDLLSDSVYYQLNYSDGQQYYTSWSLSGSNLKWDTVVVSKNVTRYTTFINSNRMEFEMSTEYGEDVSPLLNYGKLPGVLVSFTRNGQTYMSLKEVKKEKAGKKTKSLIPEQLGKRATSREIANLKKQQLVLTKRIFDNDQIHWGANTDHNEAAWKKNGPVGGHKLVPQDTTIHFAGGTLILKRVHFDALPNHYQLFAELHQQSNGDAYDRTGSIFVIPNSKVHTFFEGIAFHPDSLPLLYSKTGERFQGVVSNESYDVPVELVRFFTPFGVNHFNDRVQLDGLEWEDEAYYKQEITDVAALLKEDVWIGAFIGNYDGGGHKVTLDIKAYPGSETWEEKEMEMPVILPLFNTCNVLEMAGQNYGKIFGTDSLKVTFTIPEQVNGKAVKRIRLRYISTGHGGWGGGDEFNPKENEIFVDGKKRFSHTPWRGDCGTFREFNPVSGNFWNGVSSSDYSRSGWCPGTATQPVYFDLTGLSAGKHTISVAIPMGENEGGSFSHWCVSGALIVE